LGCEDDILSIIANREGVMSERGEDYHHDEYFFGSFFRSFQIPTNVDQENILAEMPNGVLKIFLPKGERSCAQSSKITIK
jgi:HSP20 family protein